MCFDIDIYVLLIVVGFGFGEVVGDCYFVYWLWVCLVDCVLI